MKPYDLVTINSTECRKKSLLSPPMTSSFAADYRRLKEMKPISSQSVELNSVCLSLACGFRVCVFF